jgi:threonine/homoserine/homoserine lactone efflux protein
MFDLQKNTWVLLLGSFFGLVVILIGSCGILSIITNGKICGFGVLENLLAIYGAIYLISTGYQVVRQAWDIKRSRGKAPSA